MTRPRCHSELLRPTYLKLDILSHVDSPPSCWVLSCAGRCWALWRIQITGDCPSTFVNSKFHGQDTVEAFHLVVSSWGTEKLHREMVPTQVQPVPHLQGSSTRTVPRAMERPPPTSGEGGELRSLPLVPMASQGGQFPDQHILPLGQGQHLSGMQSLT